MSKLHAPASCLNPIFVRILAPLTEPASDAPRSLITGNPLNPEWIAPADDGDAFDADFGASFASRGGHADETTVDHTDADDNARAMQAELDAGMIEWEQDQAIQTADTAHLATLAEAVAKAKELYGNNPVRVQRCLTIGGKGNPVDYFGMLDGRGYDSLIAIGTTPTEAVEKLGEKIDEQYGIAAEFSGYVVDRIAYVAGGDHRTTAEAQQSARRIALDVAYLDTLMELHVEGVYDLRPVPVAQAA
jgi:hypothetical protein